ncbi:hypothetical protein [Streptomyces fradiae]|uniref:hypothetical protein n=1 Tax=Streptomyces fradiae TaxID=1906 RepID=UPI0035BE8425
MSKAETEPVPSVGDEVLEGKTRAVVTDIRGGVIWLRPTHGGGGTEWPVEDPRKLTMRRTRAEMIEAGDL